MPQLWSTVHATVTSYPVISVPWLYFACSWDKDELDLRWGNVRLLFDTDSTIKDYYSALI